MNHRCVDISSLSTSLGIGLCLSSMLSLFVSFTCYSFTWLAYLGEWVHNLRNVPPACIFPEASSLCSRPLFITSMSASPASSDRLAVFGYDSISVTHCKPKASCLYGVCPTEPHDPTLTSYTSYPSLQFLAFILLQMFPPVFQVPYGLGNLY